MGSVGKTSITTGLEISSNQPISSFHASKKISGQRSQKGACQKSNKTAGQKSAKG
jgi:hypothetical protein